MSENDVLWLCAFGCALIVVWLTLVEDSKE